MQKYYKLTVAMGPVPTLVMDLFTMQSFWPNVSWVDKDGLKTFVNQADIEKLHKRGLSDFKDKQSTQIVIEAIKQAGIDFTKFVNEFDYTKNISESDISKFLNLASAFLVGYSEFSELLFEEVYVRSKTDSKYTSALELIEESKNNLREQLNAAFFEPDNQYEHFLNAIAEKTSIPIENLNWYLGTELKALNSSQSVSEEELKNRKEAFVHELFDDDSPATFLSGRDAQAFISNFSAKYLTTESGAGISGAAGAVAYEVGNAIIGTVCKIEADLENLSRTNELMDKMPHGSILIAQQTAPELLPAMKKAAAIVTDIGGMLSHAAITSRELQIACIVGTNSSTQLFKNGDKVIVDTKSGTIKFAD